MHVWYIRKEHPIPRSMRGWSCGYGNCGRYSSWLKDIHPKLKVTKWYVSVSVLHKKIRVCSFISIFELYTLIADMHVWYIRKGHPIPCSMRGWSCCYINCGSKKAGWMTYPHKLKVTKWSVSLSVHHKKICVCSIFLSIDKKFD